MMRENESGWMHPTIASVRDRLREHDFNIAEAMFPAAYYAQAWHAGQADPLFAIGCGLYVGSLEAEEDLAEETDRVFPAEGDRDLVIALAWISDRIGEILGDDDQRHCRLTDAEWLLISGAYDAWIEAES